MATTFDLDLEALLAPISEDNPVGVDLRSDDSASNPWYTIRDYRGDARRAEREQDRGERHERRDDTARGADQSH